MGCTLLIALVQPIVCDGQLTLPEKDVDISSGRPVEFLSTRNKVAPETPLWLDPWIRARYRIAKRVDQALHRMDKWHGDNNPFWRMHKE